MRRVGVRSPFATPEGHPLYSRNHSNSNSHSYSYRNRRRSPPPLSSHPASSSSSASRHYAPIRVPERTEKKRPRHVGHVPEDLNEFGSGAQKSSDLTSTKSSPLIKSHPPHSPSTPPPKGRLEELHSIAMDDDSFQINDDAFEALCKGVDADDGAYDFFFNQDTVFKELNNRNKDVEMADFASEAPPPLEHSNNSGCESAPPEKSAVIPHSECNNLQVKENPADAKSPTAKGSPHFSCWKSPAVVDVTDKFKLTADKVSKEQPIESDLHRLSQRQKQIDLGKNTLGYECYTNLVPRYKRKKTDPRTPVKTQVCSKRSWEGQVRKWRRLLHAYDPPAEEGEEVAEDLMCLKQVQKPIIADPPTTPNEEQGSVKKDMDLSIYGEWTELEP